MQATEHVGRFFWVLQRDALGELELEVCGLEPRRRERVRDDVDEVGTLNLSHRHVDRYRKLGSRAPPLGELRTSRTQHPSAQLRDEARALRSRNELDRGHQPELRMLP